MRAAANILLLGKTGVGKSSFINYFVGEDVARTGAGEPVTQENFLVYEYEGAGFPIRVYDTRGVEAMSAADQIEDLRAEIVRRSRQRDIGSWFHTIFYCVSMANPRFEDFEASLVCNLRESLGQHIHIILTQCDAATPAQIAQMHATVQKKLGGLEGANGFRVFDVVSVDGTKRSGQVVRRSGREDVMESVFGLLLSDIADRVAGAYARELHYALGWMLEEAHDGLDRFIDGNARWSGFRSLLADRNAIDARFDAMQSRANRRIRMICEMADRQFARVLRPAAELYASYKGATTGSYVRLARLNVDAAASWANAEDICKAFGPEDALSKALSRCGERAGADPASMTVSDMLRFVGGAAMDLLSLKRNLKNLSEEWWRESVRRIPSEKKLQEQARHRIMATFDVMLPDHDDRNTYAISSGAPT